MASKLRVDELENLSGSVTVKVEDLKVGDSGSGIPSGLISMWSGEASNIPEGWTLCDGTNGAPDLTDKFIIGAGGSRSIGDSEGQAEVTLAEGNLPAHSHSASTGNAGGHSHSGSTNTKGNHSHKLERVAERTVREAGSSSPSDDVLKNTFGGDLRTDTSGNHSHSLNINSAGNHSHSVSVESTGGGESFSIIPPAYALAYIMKL